MLASSVLVVGGLAAAGSAAAEDGSGDAGATATLEQQLYHGGPVVVDGSERVAGGLFTLDTGKGSVYTYCIDFGHYTKDGAKYQEAGWDATSLANNPNAGRIKWILENSYPAKGVAELPVKGLNEDQAAAGTQAAIWHFSDGKDAVPKDPAAARLTTYLEENAAVQEEPKPSLELTPDAVSGKSGDLIGPVNVSANATVQLRLDDAAAKSGVKLVDRDGRPVTEASNGSAVYFSVPAGAAPGTATLTASATTEVPVGRAFTSLGYTPQQHSQTMILAGSGKVDVSDTATATWARKGAIPAAEAREYCQSGKVVVTVSNNGDEDFTGTVSGRPVTVHPGGKQEVAVPVAEDAHYAIEVKGSNGFSKTFEGVLDCRTSSSTGGGTAGGTAPSASPSPAPSSSATGGTTGTAGGSTTGATTGGGLAETGSSSATPVIAGVAAVLVVVGGGVVFFLRRRRSS
ncbi:thioester domain-containing protein [Streptomyces sp. NPDC001380]|uniref:thioester domain-containing protein n=1 Tax=Streptomyces sp. NPDC001380 TaxID=3364566 RepID=UPI0036797987